VWGSGGLIKTRHKYWPHCIFNHGSIFFSFATYVFVVEVSVLIFGVIIQLVGEATNLTLYVHTYFVF
jgi:hypothetical protein